MKTQWHPVFARLLRPLVEGHYDVKINVPVGDLPREADIALLRRTSQGPLPFRGLWRWLTTWNVLEFKGPTVSARVGDVDLLIEVGLGVHRRLNEERGRERESPVGVAEVSLWYLVNHLGGRFLRDAGRHLGPLEEQGPGVWRCGLLGRTLFLVSGADLPVDEDSVPLHVIGKEPPATERELAHFLVRRPPLWQQYGGWLATLHPEAFREVQAMAKTKRGKFDFQVEPLIDAVGLKRVIEVAGLKRVIDEVGLKRVIDEVGLKPVLKEVGPARVREEMGLDWLVSNLSPDERRQLKELL